MESEGSNSSNKKKEGKYFSNTMKKAINHTLGRFGNKMGKWDTLENLPNPEPIASSTPREGHYNGERILPVPNNTQLKQIHEGMGYAQGESSDDSFESSSGEYHRNKDKIEDFDNKRDRRKKTRPDIENGDNYGQNFTENRYGENSNRLREWEHFNRLQSCSPNGLIAPGEFVYPPLPMEGNAGSADMDFTCMGDDRSSHITIRNAVENREYLG